MEIPKGWQVYVTIPREPLLQGDNTFADVTEFNFCHLSEVGPNKSVIDCTINLTIFYI